MREEVKRKGWRRDASGDIQSSGRYNLYVQLLHLVTYNHPGKDSRCTRLVHAQHVMLHTDTKLSRKSKFKKFNPPKKRLGMQPRKSNRATAKQFVVFYFF